MLEIWSPLLILAVAGYAWYHVLRLREHAIVHARRLCNQAGLQLLDESVSLHRLRFVRRHGAWHAMREYRFDTSAGGNDRRTASVTLLGGHVVGASMPTSDAPTPATPATIDDRGQPSGRDTADGNVVPIRRTRRTLH